MVRPLIAFSALLCLHCATPAPAPPPVETPPPGAPAPTSPPPPATQASCNADSDCPGGQVCERCGPQGECAPGCHQNSQCPAGHACRQVQCIRCPCPGQCDS